MRSKCVLAVGCGKGGKIQRLQAPAQRYAIADIGARRSIQSSCEAVDRETGVFPKFATTGTSGWPCGRQRVGAPAVCAQQCTSRGISAKADFLGDALRKVVSISRLAVGRGFGSFRRHSAKRTESARYETAHGRRMAWRGGGRAWLLAIEIGWADLRDGSAAGRKSSSRGATAVAGVRHARRGLTGRHGRRPR